jgi:hypothetical protein
VVASSVLLYGGSALGTLFGVGGDPVGRLRVVVTFLDPLLDQVTSKIAKKITDLILSFCHN